METDHDPFSRFEQLGAGERRRLIVSTAFVSLAIVTLLVAGYYVAPWDEDGGGLGVGVRVVLSLLALVGATLWAVRSVTRARHPVLRAFQVLTGLVAVAVLAFASAYVVMSTADPDAFSEALGHTDALYFAMATATTVGYGDISPATEPARVAVMLQMVVNVLVIGIAVRALITTARRKATNP